MRNVLVRLASGRRVLSAYSWLNDEVLRFHTFKHNSVPSRHRPANSHLQTALLTALAGAMCLGLA